VREEDLREAGRKIRLIICDLDGTLLNSRKLISPENLAAVREARSRGIFVTICSGRVHPMLEAYSRTLNIQGPLIAANGGVIFDTRNGEILYRNLAEGEKIYHLLRFCLKHGMDHIVVSSRACWYSENSRRIRRFEQYNDIAEADKLQPIPLRRFGAGTDAAGAETGNNYREALKDGIYKVLISGISPKEQVMIEAYIRSLGGLSSTSSEPDLLDVSAEGVDKGNGVRILAKHLGLIKEQICVFGDYWNDIPMMEAAGLPIAMGNGDSRVKACALAVTGSNDEDGVASAIKKYILWEAFPKLQFLGKQP
jgi:Cof subfamily protein (haloacid dehalogenase superfamily)